MQAPTLQVGGGAGDRFFLIFKAMALPPGYREDTGKCSNGKLWSIQM
jgi:hypothetical protein